MDIKIPSQGVAMTEGMLNAWLKQPGDHVEEGEAVAEVETDKTTIELVSPGAGILGPHLVAEGDTVDVGVTIVQVLAADDGVAPPEAPARTAPSPLSRRARALQEQAERATNAIPEVDSVPVEVAAPEPKFRALIAERVAESWRTIPHFTVSREISAEPLMNQLLSLRQSAPTLTVTDLLVVALGKAISVAYDLDSVDVGLAVATAHGVMIPVLTDVTTVSWADVAQQRAKAVERARAGKLSAQDLRTPTSTLSNLGSYGVDSFTGIIAVGQPTLMTVGRVAPRIVVAGEGFAIARTFNATLNADHRALDGADAARILAAFAETCASRSETTNESRA